MVPAFEFCSSQHAHLMVPKPRLRSDCRVPVSAQQHRADAALDRLHIVFCIEDSAEEKVHILFSVFSLSKYSLEQSSTEYAEALERMVSCALAQFAHLTVWVPVPEQESLSSLSRQEHSDWRVPLFVGSEQIRLSSVSPQSSDSQSADELVFRTVPLSVAKVPSVHADFEPSTSPLSASPIVLVLAHSSTTESAHSVAAQTSSLRSKLSPCDAQSSAVHTSWLATEQALSLIHI